MKKKKRRTMPSWNLARDFKKGGPRRPGTWLDKKIKEDHAVLELGEIFLKKEDHAVLAS